LYPVPLDKGIKSWVWRATGDANPVARLCIFRKENIENEAHRLFLTKKIIYSFFSLCYNIDTIIT
jgi:hypothetical protein